MFCIFYQNRKYLFKAILTYDTIFQNTELNETSLQPFSKSS